MQTAQFPASAASTLIEGYCEDFASLASVFAQTLEQVSMRGLNIGSSRARLESIENGMRELANAIHDLLENHPVKSGAGDKPPERTTRPQAPGAPAAAAPAVAVRGPGAPGLAAPGLAAPAPRAVAAARPAAAANHAEPAPMRGTNQSMPLLSVVQFIGRTRKSGELRIDLGAERMSFRFLDGAVCATDATNTPAGERLGDLLVDLGFCKREDIDTLMRGSSDAPGKRLGDLVVSTGLVSNGQVVEALESQVQRRFLRACRTPTATYEFQPGPRLPGDGRIMISSFELAYEANRASRRQ